MHGWKASSLLLVDFWIVVFLQVVFGFSGLDKLIHFDGFVRAINNYRIIQWSVGAFLAPIIIAAECTIAVGLMKREWRRAAALQAAALAALFTVALIGNRLLGAEGICGCWFSINMPRDDAHFALNILLIILSLFVWHASREGLSGTPQEGDL